MSKLVEETFNQNTANHLCEGNLWKAPRSLFGGKWRKRFVCLDNDSTLRYFQGIKQKGVIKIHHQCYATAEDRKKCPEEPGYFVFRVDNRNEKIYFASKTATERNAWIIHINAAAKGLKDLQYSKNKAVVGNVGKCRASVTGIVEDSDQVYIPKRRILTKETFPNEGVNDLHSIAPPELPSVETHPTPRGAVFPTSPPAPIAAANAQTPVEFAPPPTSRPSYNLAPPPTNSAPQSVKAVRRTWKEGENGEYLGLYVWGANTVGQLGFNETDLHSTTTPRKVKLMVGSKHSVEVASAGEKHTFCLTQNRRLYVSGCGRKGQLGCGKMKVVQRFTLMRTLKDVAVSHIACGPYHTVCQTSDGIFFSWGTGLNGCLGLGPDITYSDVPLQLNGVGVQNNVIVKRFTCGLNKTVFITQAGLVKVCGLNGNLHALGISDAGHEQVFFPTTIAAFAGQCRIIDAACGNNFSAYLNDDGQVYACGQINMEKHLESTESTQSVEQQLARVPLEPYLKPKLLNIENGYVKAIAAGDEHLLALAINTVNGSGPQLHSMGNGQNGRLGHGDNSDVNDGFKLVRSLKDAPGKQIACGNTFSAMLTKGGSLFTFGDGHSGELGNGALLDVNTPVRIHLPPEESDNACHYSYISCGADHMLSIVASGEPFGIGNYLKDMTSLKEESDNQKSSRFSDRKACLLESSRVFYKDFDGKIFGPMDGQTIMHWYANGLVSDMLKISVNSEDDKGAQEQHFWKTIKAFFSS